MIKPLESGATEIQLLQRRFFRALASTTVLFLSLTLPNSGVAETNRGLFYSSKDNEFSTAQGTKPTVRYWIERESGGDGQNSIVQEDTIFHSGDRIWVKFATNLDGYAYIINKGSSGKVSLLFPGPAGAENGVKANEEVIVPSIGYPFVLDNQTGSEQVVVVISPNRVPELETIASQTRGGGDGFELSKDLAEEWVKVSEERAVDILKEEQQRSGLFIQRESDGTYATDHTSIGSFAKPMKVVITLEHRPAE